MSGQEPAKWISPSWDPSFGDPAPELDMLRSFAEKVLRSDPEREVELCHVEDGYMYVAVRTLSEGETHVYIVERGEDEPGKWFGVFQFVDTDDETEEYIRTAEEAATLVTRKKEPKRSQS